ncbi:MAG: hypothetical protein Tsb0014_41770 [Pleurocapsa sp.]
MVFDAPAWASSELNVSEIFNAGITNLRQHNYQEAVVNFTQVIDRQDDLVGAAYSNRCLVNLQLQNYGAAQVDCLEAIADNSDNIEAYLNLGLAYYRQEKYNDAIAQYQEIIHRKKSDYRAYYNRGLAYFAQENYQNAIADHRAALMFITDSNIEAKSLIYNDLALGYMMLAEYQPAVLNFERAIALNKNNYSAYFNRGCAHHRQEKYELAIRDFSQVIRLRSDWTQAYISRGILYQKIGQSEAALRDINIALQQYQKQGDRLAYNLVVDLKHQLFNPRPDLLV